MPKIIETTVYTYDELSEKAKEKALIWAGEGAFYYDWWESAYEDAERIGLKITSFDLDRHRHAKGDIITSCPEVAESIMREHGKDCDTYKLAVSYLAQIADISAKYPCENIEEYDDEREEADNEFKRALLEEYSCMLQKEADYMQSREYLEESIRINEYTFTETGKRFG